MFSTGKVGDTTFIWKRCRKTASGVVGKLVGYKKGDAPVSWYGPDYSKASGIR